MNECLYKYNITINDKTSDADDDIGFILEDASPDNSINIFYLSTTKKD